MIRAILSTEARTRRTKRSSAAASSAIAIAFWCDPSRHFKNHGLAPGVCRASSAMGPGCMAILMRASGSVSPMKTSPQELAGDRPTTKYPWSHHVARRLHLLGGSRRRAHDRGAGVPCRDRMRYSGTFER
jgi:hypothetical protein